MLEVETFRLTKDDMVVRSTEHSFVAFERELVSWAKERFFDGETTVVYSGGTRI